MSVWFRFTTWFRNKRQLRTSLSFGEIDWPRLWLITWKKYSGHINYFWVFFPSLSLPPPSIRSAPVTMGTWPAVVRMWGPWKWESSCVHLRCLSPRASHPPAGAPAMPDLHFPTERGVTHHSGFKTSHRHGGEGGIITLKALFEQVFSTHNMRLMQQCSTEVGLIRKCAVACV